MKTIANRIQVPENTEAILWDLDGVLVDSLSLDCQIINQLLKQFVDPNASVTNDFIRSLFAYDVPVFWQKILEQLSADFPDALVLKETILPIYNQKRQSEPFPLNPGVRELVDEINSDPNLQQAIVSNNPLEDIIEILENVDLKKDFQIIVGNNMNDNGLPLQKKPAPDTYLYAAKQLQIAPENCTVIEDSLLGIEGSKKAGCHVIGVATGSTNEEQIAQSEADQSYKSLDEKK